jgi:hypothetical protein
MRYKLLTTTVFCLLCLAMVHCTTDRVSADVILHNGKIVTVDGDFSVQQAVALRDGRIVGTGPEETIMALAGDSTQLIDLKGHTVIPGLIEGHAHPIPASQSEFPDPIPVVSTIDEVLAWIKTEVARKKQNEWIIHPKFFITRMADMRQITIRELDDAAPDNPVFLNGSYGGMVNTKALELSGMNVSTHPGILTDAVTKKPTGLIRRSAFNMLAIPRPETLREGQQLEALRELFHQYNRIGFTSVCSGGGPASDLETFRKLMANGGLTVRVFHNLRVPVDLSKDQAEVAEAFRKFGFKTGDGDEWVKVGAYKVVLDGGMLTGTAFLNEGWGEGAKDLYGITDPDYRGELMLSGDELVKVISAAASTGWKFTAHVTGGGGVDTLLAAYEAVNVKTPISERRFSIIHGNFFSPQAIRKMAAMGIYADMQPAWFFKDTYLLHHVLGAERMKTFHPYRSLTEGGVVVNAGSDHMVKVDPDLSINPYNPFTAMWSVVTRQTDKGNVFNPGEAISREEALKMYTINNAYASFEEDVKGSIEKGKFADLVVLSDDLLTCAEDSIRRIKPLLTMVGGKVVFDSGELTVKATR